MDKVVSFSMGRLGNIMFCVASGKYYADKHGMDFYLLRNKSHDDYLSRYEKTFFKDIKMVDSYDDTFEVVKERKGYDPIVRKSTGNLYIDGYRESPKYWNEDKEYIYSLKDKLICTSLGSKGSEYQYNNIKGFVPSIPVKPMDTTGAGDAFFGAILSHLDGYQLKDLTNEYLDKVFRFANAVGGLTTLGKGAIDPIPYKEQVIEFLNNK